MPYQTEGIYTATIVPGWVTHTASRLHGIQNGIESTGRRAISEPLVRIPSKRKTQLAGPEQLYHNNAIAAVPG
jgi:hypothetical protein